MVDDLFSDEVRFSGDDDGDDEEEEEEEELTSRSRGKGKGKANGTRNKRAAPSKLPGRKAASKKKKTKAAKGDGFLISDLERAHARQGRYCFDHWHQRERPWGLKGVCTALACQQEESKSPPARWHPDV